MRPRELWFWLGGAFLTAGAGLIAVAVAFYTKETNYTLGTGPQMIEAYASFVLAFLCFLAAIAGWRPWLRWQRFPKLIVRVDGIVSEMASIQTLDFPPRPVQLQTLNIHITNTEVDRSTSIRAAYLLAKAKSDYPLHELLFTGPYDQVLASRPARTLEFPVNLAAQASGGGEWVFELRDFMMANVAEPFDARVEIHDAISGKMACFPAALGTFRRHRGLRLTTYEERVNGPKSAQLWYGVMGPPDPGR